VFAESCNVLNSHDHSSLWLQSSAAWLPSPAVWLFRRLLPGSSVACCLAFIAPIFASIDFSTASSHASSGAKAAWASAADSVCFSGASTSTLAAAALVSRALFATVSHRIYELFHTSDLAPKLLEYQVRSSG
jgi:hypothetical protein